MERFTFVFRPSYQCDLRSIQPTIPIARGIDEARLKASNAVLGSGSASDETVTGARIETTQNADKPNG
jgi:hypothetical protein